MSRFVTVKHTQTETQGFSINVGTIISVRLQIKVVLVKFIGENDTSRFFFETTEEANAFYQEIINAPKSE